MSSYKSRRHQLVAVYRKVRREVPVPIALQRVIGRALRDAADIGVYAERDHTLRILRASGCTTGVIERIIGTAVSDVLDAD